jgi:hypothetical protein
MDDALVDKVLVIDVGTHKAEEVRLFEGRPRFTLRNCYRLSGRTEKVRRAAAKFTRDFSCRYVLIEPVAHRELCNFLAAVPSAMFLKGVVSCDPSGETTLLLAEKSLGNSIIPTKPGLSGQTAPTYNFHFPTLYEWLVETFVTNGDCDTILLRMNAEGVEGPIIDFLVNHASVRPKVVAGSLGDIEKCFGKDAYDEANRKLADARIPFVSFTSNSASWVRGLRAITKHLLAPPTLADRALAENRARSASH